MNKYQAVINRLQGDVAEMQGSIPRWEKWWREAETNEHREHWSQLVKETEKAIPQYQQAIEVLEREGK